MAEIYNKKRPHSTLNEKTLYQKLKSVEILIPIQPHVTSKHWNSSEILIPRNYEYLKLIKHMK